MPACRTCGPQPVFVALPGEREPDCPFHGIGFEIQNHLNSRATAMLAA